MSYDVDELFKFSENIGEKLGGCAVVEYLKKGDPDVEELKIPAEYNGKPVTMIGAYAFAYSKHLERVVIPPSVRVIDAAAFYASDFLETAELSEGLEEIRSIAFEATNLKSIVLPKSLKRIFSEAFSFCVELESVIFNSAPSLGEKVFFGCPDLPADVTLMGLVNSRDLGKPLDAHAFNTAFDDRMERTPSPWRSERLKYTRPDVFELAAKNHCFRSVDASVVLKILIEKGDTKSLRIAGEHGMLDNAALLGALAEYSAKLGKTEITAYLLDIKKRKFGFDGGDKFEL